MELQENSSRSDISLDFVDHFSAGRIWGAWLALLPVGAAFHEVGAPPVLTILLLLGCLVWPQIVRRLVRLSDSPYHTQCRCMYIDTLLAGIAIGVLGFKPLPSALLVGHLALSLANMAGVTMLARGAALIGAGMLLGLLASGFHFHPAVTGLDVWTSLPFMLLQPVIVGYGGYRTYLSSELVRNHWKRLSRTDSLTGLVSRRYWEEIVARELRRYHRYRTSASLLLIDIDYFKVVNDRHGHHTGDEVIRAITKAINGCLRKTDSAGRYGGEEFGVLLPATPLKKALLLAERLRTRVDEQRFGGDLAIHCTLSIGVVELTDTVAGPGEWINLADRALYRAKALGRNRVVVYRDEQAPIVRLAQ